MRDNNLFISNRFGQILVKLWIVLYIKKFNTEKKTQKTLKRGKNWQYDEA